MYELSVDATIQRQLRSTR